MFLRSKTVLRKRKEVNRPISPESDADCQATNAKQSRVETSGIVQRCTPLTVQEFEEAEFAMVRFVQSQSFTKELDALRQVSRKDGGDQRGQAKQKKMVLKKKSSIARLDPFVHEGLLRVGGRLSRADDLPGETRHPVILPRQSRVTNLIIQRSHEILAHGGRGHTC